MRLIVGFLVENWPVVDIVDTTGLPHMWHTGSKTMCEAVYGMVIEMSCSLPQMLDLGLSAALSTRDRRDCCWVTLRGLRSST